MKPTRLEAFSDGVLAIIITIMVLGISPPGSHTLDGWRELLPKVLVYLFSFVIIAIYWNNHHHLISATKHITVRIMWANMHLLFWLSLIPVGTAWLGEHRNYHYSQPVALYAFIGLMAGIAYYLLSRSIIAANADSDIKQRIGKDTKGVMSIILYLLAMGVAFVSPVVSLLLLAGTAVIWLIPDKRLTHDA